MLLSGIIFILHLRIKRDFFLDVGRDAKVFL